MKKILILAIAISIPVAAFAFEFSIGAISSEQMYPESQYDPYGFSNEIGAFYIPDVEERRLEFIAYHDDGTDTRLEATPIGRQLATNTCMSFYLTGKLTAGVAVLPMTFDFGDSFPTIRTDIDVKVGLSLTLEGTNSNKLFGFDGSYFVGPEIKVGEGTVIRTGLLHLSGHVGDEVMEKVELYNGVRYLSSGKEYITIDGTEYVYYGLAEYVRDNSFSLAVSQKLPWGFSVYAEFTQPMHSSYVRPFYECPTDHTTTTDSDDWPTTWHNLAGVGGLYNVLSNQGYCDELTELASNIDSSYKAIRLHFGANWSMTFGNVELSAGFDVQAHQDGQTLHRLDGYSSDNPWEYEITAGVGVTLLEFANGHGLGLTVEYHDGRFPSLCAFNNRVRTVGFSLTFR